MRKGGTLSSISVIEKSHGQSVTAIAVENGVDAPCYTTQAQFNQEIFMKTKSKFANKPAGNDEYQQGIAEAANLNSGALIQEKKMKTLSKTVDKTEGKVESQQMIAEVAEFHEERLQQEVEIEARNESANKPEGNYDYEQMIAENTVFSTKEKIEEAAYFIAQRRGFAPGHELSDWHQAETEVEGMLCSA
jgi:hypothetical protein